ncbi:hypothetical protein JMJ77_0007943 [Colletotrichum scovillei]|uniref:Uncharacterized protein n=1 Tax=Colletotrichum scovillei TaxID=1209932 RepID=A0A9P7RD74_9PEZI|nr:hypothetical protein JMJ77_0007943 [Colletotrichum scovillei]KAG7074932.1 hypothetical protein JMJ76_0011397 [Colletotrichum scovillei]KAG7082029.1 hypothetical protein JMJ78_0004136 [Colletotrichum scovillei]
MGSPASTTFRRTDILCRNLPRLLAYLNTPVFRGSLHPGPKLPSRGHCQLGRSDPRGTSAALQSAGGQWIASTLFWLDATAGPLHLSAGIMNVRKARESNLELSQTLTLSLSRLPGPPSADVGWTQMGALINRAPLDHRTDHTAHPWGGGPAKSLTVERWTLQSLRNRVTGLAQASCTLSKQAAKRPRTSQTEFTLAICSHNLYIWVHYLITCYPIVHYRVSTAASIQGPDALFDLAVIWKKMGHQSTSISTDTQDGPLSTME